MYLRDESVFLLLAYGRPLSDSNFTKAAKCVSTISITVILQTENNNLPHSLHQNLYIQTKLKHHIVKQVRCLPTHIEYKTL